MSNNLKILIGFGAAVAILAGIYIWISSPSSLDESMVVSESGEPITGSIGTASEEDKRALVLREGREILQILSLLNSASIDSKIFETGVFSSIGLEDFSVAVPKLETGRTNPFSPISAPSVSSAPAASPSGASESVSE